MKVRLEMPSGVTLQEKIRANIQGYYKLEMKERLEAGDSLEDVREDFENIIRTNIKILAEKFYLVIVE